MAVLRGVRTLADAVSVTLGPCGRHAMIQRTSGAPFITKDGVTVATVIELEDPYENAGVHLVKEAATRSRDLAGDGTATAIVLAASMVQEGVKHLTAGASPMAVGRGLDRATEFVMTALHEQSRPCASHRALEQVATVSANGDPALGALIAEAIERVGADGLVAVEACSRPAGHLDVIEGSHFDRGYRSPEFVIDPDQPEVIVEQPLILICESGIARLDDLMPLIRHVKETGSSLVIISEELAPEVFAALVENVRRGILKVVAVPAPAFGAHRRNLLEDLAALTGTTVVSDELGPPLRHAQPEGLGRAGRVTISGSRTTVVGGAGNLTDVAVRLARVRSALATSASDHDRVELRERAALLAGRMAVMRIGALTETESSEKKARTEDALHAARAASRDGILPGGGLALVRAAAALDRLRLPGDEQVGVKVLRRALEAPIRHIAENAGYSGSVVLSMVRQAPDSIGFDAARGGYVDMVSEGILDPTTVTCSALAHAASVAALVLSSEVIVADPPGEHGRAGEAEWINPERPDPS